MAKQVGIGNLALLRVRNSYKWHTSKVQGIDFCEHACRVLLALVLDLASSILESSVICRKQTGVRWGFGAQTAWNKGSPAKTAIDGPFFSYC